MGPLCFSVIVNLIVVGALLAQRSARTSEAPPALVIAITEGRGVPAPPPLVTLQENAAPSRASAKRPAPERVVTITAPLQKLPVSEALSPEAPERDAADENARGDESNCVAQSTPEGPVSETDANGLLATPAGPQGSGAAEVGPGPAAAPPGTVAATPVAYVYYVGPRYPALAERNGWEGEVLLTLSIDASGRVARAAVAASSGHDVLDRSALDAARIWRFAPARKNGATIARTVNVPVSFVLKRLPAARLAAGSAPTLSGEEP